MTRTWQQERADVVAWLEARLWANPAIWSIRHGEHVRRKPKRPKRRKR